MTPEEYVRWQEAKRRREERRSEARAGSSKWDDNDLGISPKSWMMVMMMAIFTSGWHRWYLNRYAEAVMQSLLNVALIGSVYYSSLQPSASWANFLGVVLGIAVLALWIRDIVVAATGAFEDGDGMLVEVPPSGKKLDKTMDKLALAVPVAPCVLACLVGVVAGMVSFALMGPTDSDAEYYNDTQYCYDEYGNYDYEECYG